MDEKIFTSQMSRIYSKFVPISGSCLLGRDKEGANNPLEQQMASYHSKASRRWKV